MRIQAIAIGIVLPLTCLAQGSKDKVVADLIANKDRAKFVSSEPLKPLPPIKNSTLRPGINFSEECKDVKFENIYEKLDSRVKPGMILFRYASSENIGEVKDEALGFARIDSVDKAKESLIVKAHSEVLLLKDQAAQYSPSKDDKTSVSKSLLSSVRLNDDDGLQTCTQATGSDGQPHKTCSSGRSGFNYGVALSSILRDGTCSLGENISSENTLYQEGQYLLADGKWVPAVQEVTRVHVTLKCLYGKEFPAVMTTTYVNSFDVPSIENPHGLCHGVRLLENWQIKDNEQTTFSNQTRKVLKLDGI